MLHNSNAAVKANRLITYMSWLHHYSGSTGLTCDMFRLLYCKILVMDQLCAADIRMWCPSLPLSIGLFVNTLYIYVFIFLVIFDVSATVVSHQLALSAAGAGRMVILVVLREYEDPVPGFH